MTKDEALAKAKEGHKITHRYMSDDEYLYEDKRGVLRTEEGYTVKLDFWGYRSQPEWQIDWEIWTE